MIKTQNLTFKYPNMTIINNLNLEIKKGDFVAITGENGAGKSTLIKLIRGLLKPNSGKIFVDGKDISKDKISSLAKKIGFLFQNPDRQLCKETVGEELMFTLECTIDDTTKHEQMCSEMLKEFSLSADDEILSLSRGECQKVVLASALVSCPDVLILDEPTTGLDYKECKQIMRLIKEMNEKGVTVVMICHDMEIVLEYAKRVVVMAGGEILGDATPIEVFYNAELLEKGSLMPPQIIELSQNFGNTFGKVSTYEEMAEEISNKKVG